jgi:ubiquinone/menaquinone biosynthesis C-methylase UbiE
MPARAREDSRATTWQTLRLMSEQSPANPWAQGWTDDIARRWLANEEAMERAMTPFGAAAVVLAHVLPGERVVDVGCGGGPSTLALAEAVGPQGRVLGVDVAAPLLERARQRLAGRPHVELVQADAQTFPFTADHDLCFSRFGVMFFADFAAAFRNLAGALRAGGRLAFVCWRRFEDNPWAAVSFAALRRVLPQAKEPVDGPGPFAFADATRTRELLAGAGFTGIAIDPFDAPVNMGPDVQTAVHLATHSGPTGRALLDTDQETRAAVREQVTAALSPHLGPGGVFLPGSAWLVHARR